MPAPPEFRGRGAQVGRDEIAYQIEAQQACGAPGNIGIAPEIRQDLDGKRPW